jgi:dCMP deaminase
MTQITIAYIPVLHEGYLRFLKMHAEGRPLYLIGRELYRDYRPLAKDIRRLDEQLVADAIRSWSICSDVEILTEERAEKLAIDQPAIVLPDEDVSFSVVERYFPRCEVLYDTTFLRWDKTRTARLQPPLISREVTAETAADELGLRSVAAASTSADWFRRVGAAIRYRNGDIDAVANEHLPHPLSPYVVGDPRINFFQGVHIELSTSIHAEARLIAAAARFGHRTEGAHVYVTDFPCPPCAKLLAAAGIVKLVYSAGYSRLDGVDVLREAGIEVVRVAEQLPDHLDGQQSGGKE